MKNKITEQDLFNLGFKRKWLNDKSGYWLEKTYRHKALKKVVIYTSHELRYIHLTFIDCNNDVITKKLNRANLELFIRFAEGNKIT